MKVETDIYNVEVFMCLIDNLYEVEDGIYEMYFHYVTYSTYEYNETELEYIRLIPYIKV